MPKNYSKEETEGKWITVKGRHILLRDGETVEDALSRSDKAMGKEKELEKAPDDMFKRDKWFDKSIYEKLPKKNAS